ncbi:protein ALTERED PHOSPHATE STARVATION RESPONSE 1-like isoform X2 [Hibiscus syriacus]|uniref:protein ALTERED PHOSPHATE STARVATION RESPONSE 1-like isoform X2 n=1 Tax=Hibiscus syriacus TaxID=106335 RepID=UPI0019204ED1|nr:protein ALTERED PHOSPHATE STARVATION RESPONSE 1-like isoform X2 [Hibiscus syriacus]
MGCAASKLDRLPAVSLCRDRCHFLDGALQQSYALADAQVAYMRSLKSLGPTLRHFFDQSLKSTSSDDSVVNPPKQATPPSSPDHSLSSSNSDSHIQFDTDLEEEEMDKDFGSSFNQINTSYHNYHGNTHQNSEFINSGWKTPPPPAPRSAAWDYLNFFDELYDRYELPYSLSKAVKNKEGSHYPEAHPVKQIHGDEKSTTNNIKTKREENQSGEADSPTDLNEPRNQSDELSVSKVMEELQALFERASESGNEVLKMLDTGKFRYHHKKSVYQGSTKIFHMISSNSSETESLLSKEKTGSMDDDENISSQNLSSILRKLRMWETKLYDEVKAEEKLRIIYAKTFKQMKSLNQKGANARKVDSTRSLVRVISTKMRVAVQVIDKVAITINKLMDEELWPEVNELIHRLFGMWKVMLECHSCQCQKVMEAKCFDFIALNEKLNDVHLEVAMRLKLELQNWSLSFSSWIEAQRGFVKALNGWLRRCIVYEPEETADGVSPLSPGRGGAPLVFVILNKWSEAMDKDKLSENEVVEAVHGLVMSVNRVVEQKNTDMLQRIVADKDMEKKVKMLEKEGQRMQKLLQARAKKITRFAREERDVLLPRDTTRHSDIRDAGSWPYGLKQIFRAMEKLATHSRQAYEDIHNCIEDSKAPQDNP